MYIFFSIYYYHYDSVPYYSQYYPHYRGTGLGRLDWGINLNMQAHCGLEDLTSVKEFLVTLKSTLRGIMLSHLKSLHQLYTQLKHSRCEANCSPTPPQWVESRLSVELSGWVLGTGSELVNGSCQVLAEARIRRGKCEIVLLVSICNPKECLFIYKD